MFAVVMDVSGPSGPMSGDDVRAMSSSRWGSGEGGEG